MSNLLTKLLLAVTAAPPSVVLTFLLLPLWSWCEHLSGIESVGHSGPAPWCYLVSLVLCLALLSAAFRTLTQRRWLCVVFVSAASLSGSSSLAMQVERLPTFLGWVGLFSRELVAWLENENRLVALCTPDDGSARWSACRERYLAPKVAVIVVRSEPRRDAQAVGTIVVVALPGRGLRAFASGSGDATAFTPDLYDNDWGYGPYFHQTILEERGSWYRVPVDPLPPGWIDSMTWTDHADVRVVRAGDILATHRGDVLVLGVDGGELRVRPEQEADMWCRQDPPPVLTPWRETAIPFRELFDARGHLRVRTKYTRGC